MKSLAQHKKLKRDYQRRNSSNPFFHQNSKKNKKSLKSGFKFLAFFLVLLVLLVFLGTASCWKIKKIEIKGLVNIPEKNIADIIKTERISKEFGIFSKNNIFLFNKKQVANKIRTKYDVADLKVKKVFPHSLSVEINERPLVFIFKEKDQYFYVSNDAYLVKKLALSDENQEKFFLVENERSQSLIENKHLDLSARYLEFILNLIKNLKNKQQELPVQKFIIGSEFETLKVQISKGPLVYFNIKDTASKQLENLLLVKKEKIKDNFSRTKYIDLRYGQRVFINPNFN